LRRQRRICHRFCEPESTFSEKVRTECLLIEERDGAKSERLEELPVRGVGIPIDIDADFADHLFGDGWVGFRRFQHHGAAVPDVRATIERELITFRMAAEVVVIVEEQDACVRIDIATIDVCG
jgi:hypothetical protein